MQSDPRQSQPGSSWQLASHPCTLPGGFPVSQVSSPATMPSPQPADSQGVSGASQTHPLSSLQFLEHPSPETVFPSSHSSFPAIMPSPHAAATQPFPPHTQPSSSWQVLEHPSPEVVFPSSHSSSPLTMPSPQTSSSGHPSGVSSQRTFSIWHNSLQPSHASGGRSGPPS